MNDPSIDILTQRLAEADIDPQLRDSLASDLDWAAAINGNPDPAQQGIKRMVVSGVRRELLACDRDRETKSSIEGTKTAIEEAKATIEGIVKTCAERHAAGAADPVNPASGSAKFAAVVWLARELAPWRWPVAIAVCSPWTPQIIRTAADVFTK